MRRLVNEKTLELNITHELMNRLGVRIFGLTPNYDEPLIGADIEYFSPIGTKYIIQFKAAKKGTDGQHGWFNLNNNPKKDQHEILDMIAQAGIIEARYLFPLVISDAFLLRNFGRLLAYTVPIEAERITGSHNWKETQHSIEVWNNNTFQVHSTESFDETDSIEIFLSKLTQEIQSSELYDISFHEYVEMTVRKIENLLIEKEIWGDREHTFIFFGRHKETNEVGFCQIPIWIQSSKENMDKKQRQLEDFNT